MMNKVLFIIYYFKIANTGHHSCMFSVVYNNIQKITNISIKKPIILISILNKYLDIPIYLDNRTPLIHDNDYDNHSALTTLRVFLFTEWKYVCLLCTEKTIETLVAKCSNRANFPNNYLSNTN